MLPPKPRKLIQTAKYFCKKWQLYLQTYSCPLARVPFCVVTYGVVGDGWVSGGRICCKTYVFLAPGLGPVCTIRSKIRCFWCLGGGLEAQFVAIYVSLAFFAETRSGLEGTFCRYLRESRLLCLESQQLGRHNLSVFT